MTVTAETTPTPDVEEVVPLESVTPEDDGDLLVEDVSIDGMCGVY